MLTRLVDAALRVSKRARSETGISTAGISLARAGLGLAQARLGGLASCRAVVLGTGSAGKLALRLLRQSGVGRLSVAGRNEAAAARLAAEVGGTALRAGDVPAALAGTDLLVTAIGAPCPSCWPTTCGRRGRAPAAARLFVSTSACPRTSTRPWAG